MPGWAGKSLKSPCLITWGHHQPEIHQQLEVEVASRCWSYDHMSNFSWWAWVRSFTAGFWGCFDEFNRINVEARWVPRYPVIHSAMWSRRCCLWWPPRSRPFRMAWTRPPWVRVFVPLKSYEDYEELVFLASLSMRMASDIHITFIFVVKIVKIILIHINSEHSYYIHIIFILWSYW